MTSLSKSSQYNRGKQVQLVNQVFGAFKDAGLLLFGRLFRDPSRSSILGCISLAFWLPLVTLWPPFWFLLAPFRSLFDAIPSFWAPSLAGAQQINYPRTQTVGTQPYLGPGREYCRRQLKSAPGRTAPAGVLASARKLLLTSHAPYLCNICYVVLQSALHEARKSGGFCVPGERPKSIRKSRIMVSIPLFFRIDFWSDFGTILAPFLAPFLKFL